jgi:hypothetical protein
MARTVLQLGDRNRPNVYLRPLVDALVARGNAPVRTHPIYGPFFPTQGGWDCLMRDRLDWDFLTKTFEIPGEISYDEARDTIVDKHGWAEIRGSGGPSS